MGLCGSGKSTVGLELAKQDRIPWLLCLHNQIVGWKVEHRNGIIACSALKSSHRTILKNGVLENSNGQFVVENENNREVVPNSLEIGSTNAELQEVVKEDILFVHLHRSKELLERRLNDRTDHSMPPSLLQSQLIALEEPTDEDSSIQIDVDSTVPEIVSQVKQICITGMK